MSDIKLSIINVGGLTIIHDEMYNCNVGGYTLEVDEEVYNEFNIWLKKTGLDFGTSIPNNSIISLILNEKKILFIDWVLRNKIETKAKSWGSNVFWIYHDIEHALNHNDVNAILAGENIDLLSETAALEKGLKKAIDNGEDMFKMAIEISRVVEELKKQYDEEEILWPFWERY